MSEQELKQRISQIIQDRATMMAQRDELSRRIAESHAAEAVARAALNRLERATVQA